jgi:hypothetical protein
MVHDRPGKRTLGNVCGQLLLSGCVLLLPPLLMMAVVLDLGSTSEGPAQQVQPEQADKRPELATALPNLERGPPPSASGQRPITKDSARYNPDAVGDGAEQSLTVQNPTPRPTALADLSIQPPEPLASERRSSPRPAPPDPPNTVAAIEDAQPAARPNESGIWVVQLSAQRTEEEARSASRAAEARYAVLAGRQLVIRKKDQGRRGVFYAAQVGPLARDEANAVCNQIKNAGGNCFIQASAD